MYEEGIQIKNNTKSGKVTLIISVCSLIVASIALVFSKINGLKMLPSITIFFSAIAVLCCSIANYIEKNKKLSNYLI